MNWIFVALVIVGVFIYTKMTDKLIEKSFWEGYELGVKDYHETTTSDTRNQTRIDKGF